MRAQRAIKAGPWRRFLEDSALIRSYLWKYRRWVSIGLVTLIILDVLEVVPPLLLKEAVDATMVAGTERKLLWLAVAYLAVAVVQGICRYGWRMFLIRSSLLSGRDIRGRFSHHLFTLPMSFFDRKPIGDLMSLATSDTEAVRTAI